MRNKNHLVFTLVNSGEFVQARDLAQRLLERQGESSVLLEVLAQIYFKLGDKEQARKVIQRACELEPDNASLLFSAGIIFHGLGEGERAATFLAMAAERAPENAHYHNALGLAYFQLDDFSSAEGAYSRALELEPNHRNALHNLAWILHDGERWQEALSVFQRYFQQDQNDGVMWHKYGDVLDHLCLLDHSPHCFMRALQCGNSADAVYNNLVMALNYWPQHDRGAVLSYSRAFDEKLTRERGGPIIIDSPPPRPKRRLGFISGDFRQYHSVTYFLMPLLRNLDAAKWGLYLYNTHEEDESSSLREELFALATRWVELGGEDVAAAQEAIRGDRLDAIVDLSGHTAANRLDVLYGRVAPVQLSWLGYPNTTGLQAMDYRIGDPVADRDGEDLYSEKMIVGDGPFSCYAPLNEMGGVEVEVDYRPNSQRVVFGSFNLVKKIGPAVMKVWADILHACPEGVLVLKSAMFYTSLVRERMIAQFAQLGIAAERIQCLPGIRDVEQHFALYNQVDVALDPFPYNGTTTTFEALWMGVPVIALAGDCHAGRIGESILTHLGRGEWVAQGEGEYVEKAVALGRNRAYVGELRGLLRSELLDSSLCDDAAFARRFEGLLESVL